MGSASVVSAAARRLQGKVALITGGARGIGECIARLFSKHGAKVLIADIKDDLGESICKDIGSSSSSANGCSYVHCDVTKEKDIENAVNTAVSQYGKLDIMFNNAGTVDEAKPNILDNDQAEFERILSINLVGAFLGRNMLLGVCGIIGGAATHAYTSSKHGLLGLMKNTAVELGRFGIRVNCVSPYAVSTPLAKDFLKLADDGLGGMYSNLKGAVLEPEDAAEAALYLGSDESKCVSGHNLVVDGGFAIVNAGFSVFGKSE
ncbi:momilactone a synthase [Citrus sinensis]|uniref:Momilactone a synthase n=2 Tax=Citrus TaxID=2706 RepID=A0ACB8IRK8_CITSI|nr:momilactone a synthase [Citrus sinensis]